MDKTTIESRDPADLSLHPRLRLVPDHWGKDDPRYISLVENIRERGIDQPLVVDAENRVMDGRLRLRAARQLQFSTVKVIVSADDADLLIASSLIQRRHQSQSQLAYLVYPLLAGAFAASGAKRLQNLRKGQQIPDSAGPALETVEQMGEHLNISRRLFFDAQKVHQLFAKHTEKRDLVDKDGKLVQQVSFREFYEPRILREDDPYGLGAVVAGIASSLRHADNPDQVEQKQLELFSEGWEVVGKRMRYWLGFEADEKRAALSAVRETFTHMPDELLTGMQRLIKEVKKARKKTKRGPLKEAA